MKCSRCYSDLYECDACDGQTKRDPLGSVMACSECRSTGWLCPTDKGFWER